MTEAFSPAALEAFLDEALPVEEMARLEGALRRSPELRAQLAAIHARRDAGIHSLGEIWRRHRLGCPDREALGSYLLGAVTPEFAAFVRQHVDLVGCLWCRSNLADLARQHSESDPVLGRRRQRYFESSAGYLRSK